MWPRALYHKAVLEYPAITLITLAVSLGALWLSIPDFQLDASSDSLVLENDPDLRYYHLLTARYSSDEYLVITYRPDQPLFSNHSLTKLRKLRDALKALQQVGSVNTILDAPLFQSPPVSLFSMGKDYQTLSMDSVDSKLAVTELTTSPLYADLLLSRDAKTTTLQVNFVEDPVYDELLQRRDQLVDKKHTLGLQKTEDAELATVSNAIFSAQTAALAKKEQVIKSVRSIIAQFDDEAVLFLGGLPMIVVDMIAFVRNDLFVFGASVVVIMALTLAIVFRHIIWVGLAISVSLIAGFSMIAYLGLVNWRVTVISSNFFSLVLIMTIAIMIHLIVRYRELLREDQPRTTKQLVELTMRSMARPCFYTTVTTMVAFGSLIVSGIRPVIDFGWMMTLGVGFGFILAFLVFPATLMVLPRPTHGFGSARPPLLTAWLAELATARGRGILVVFLLVVTVAIPGVFKLSIENRFTDYFRESTDIYQGLAEIDTKLGGTTPLEVIIDGLGQAYFDDPVLRDLVDDLHGFLEALPETGKVLSIATFTRVAQQANDGFPLDNFYLNLVEKQMPPELRVQIFEPYASREHDQLRFALRVRETDPDLRRQALIDVIRDHLVDDLGLQESQVHINGMLVLYNNMLQSLYRSQIQTLGAVFVAIMTMFFFVFRSFSIAAIAIIPNLFPAMLVLGLMGWTGIPLDMMTITIAAIAIGIGVDDTIHYIHRYREEFSRCGNYAEAVRRSHQTIGRAIYFTSLTITVGFSILALSNFVPTIYFGLLTSFAMVVAVIADLTILPVLLMLVEPLGPERRGPSVILAAPAR